MAYDAVNVLKLTIERLVESSRVSIESPSREILECASYGVKAATQVLYFLGDLRKGFWSETMKALGGERMKALEEEIKETASRLEYVLDCHVSDQFLSQSKTESVQLAGVERRLLLFSLDLRGIQQDIDGFTQKMKKLQKLFHTWEKEDGDGDETESFMAGLYDQYCGRTRLIYWFASKAASRFLGTREEYIQELDSLLPEEEEEEEEDDDDDDDEEEEEEEEDDDEEEEEDDDDGDDDDEDEEEEYTDSRVKDVIMSWWINKAASVFMMERDYIKELEEEKDNYDAPSITEFAENMSNMVGATDMFYQIRDSLFNDEHRYRCTSIFGMAGIGKTALAMKILKDPIVSSRFESCIFVRIGKKYEIPKIVQAILAQLNLDSDIILLKGVALDEYLYRNFKDRKILIVLDDVWDNEILLYLSLRLPLGEVRGCRFLITTRRHHVGSFDKGYIMRFLNEKESWDLLLEKVFVGEACPPEFEKAGKQIAKNCEGLPLLIITVADLLSKAEKTLEYWTKIAASKKNSIFIEAYEKISEVLYPSYSNLLQHIKTCFLYLGAFPQNCEVRISKLTNLWSAEGFGGGASYKSSREVVVYNFEQLVWESVALDTQHNSVFHRLKSCSLHSVFWYLSKKEAWNEKFLHVLDSYVDASVQDIESRRRLSVYKNSIFSIKVARHSIASISGVRSLLCTGPYHLYQVPIHFGLRLLKVLDALTIRFYEFPLDVLKLVLLRYLALTCNGNLSPFISKLWSLQCLIIHQHLSIKSSISESYVPVEIWDLLELEYLQIMGRNLPEPPPGAVLTNLLILLDVGAHTCTKPVFESIPNLDKLRVRVELMPDVAEPLCFFDDISLLKQLNSLQCVIVNPELMFEAVPLAPLVSASSLTSLTLSGFGYHWKDIQIIAELPHLRVLKLRCYAFRGEEWEVGETKFRSLQYFLVEDTDLVEWTAGSKNFPALEYLTIKSCYKLQEIPQIPSVREIQLVDCNPSAVTRAKLMAPNDCLVYAESSWLDSGNLKS